MDAFLQSPWAPLLLTVVVWGVVQLIKALLDRKEGGADRDFVFLGFMAAMAVAGLVGGKLAGSGA